MRGNPYKWATKMDITLFLVTFFALELFESNWQKSDTFFGVIANNYKIYKMGIFFFFALNFTFVYSIFLMFYFDNFSFSMLSIVGLKFADIAFKIKLMQNIDEKGMDVLHQIFRIDFKMTLLFRYLNALIYPTCFYLSML